MKDNPFPTKLIQERLTQLDNITVKKLLEYVNSEPIGENLNKITDINLLEDFLNYPKQGLTSLMRKFSSNL